MPIIYIGIDTGTNTGFAIWNKKTRKLEEVCCLKIHQAMDTIKRYHTIYGSTLLVRFEDARKIKNRKFFKDKGPNALQGAGSIKRDCHIWEDFLKDNNITYQAVGPLNGLTKLSSEVFQKVTGWTQQTNNHARDAAMLVYGI